MSDTELKLMVGFAESLADEARRLVLAYGGAAPQTMYKSDASPVTELDRAVERALRERIADAFPEHGVIGEEYGPERPDAEHVWVLDPIDGTVSFVAGIPLFGVLVALCRGGVPLLGVIDMPRLGERWVGAPGHGATFNGSTVRARPCGSIGEAMLTCSSPTYFPAPLRPAFEELLDGVRLSVFGAGCYGYGRIASGFIDLGFEASHDPFDFLALVPVIEQAGGVISDWQGQPLTIHSADRFVAAGDPRVHRQALAILDKAPPPVPRPAHSSLMT